VATISHPRLPPCTAFWFLRLLHAPPTQLLKLKRRQAASEATVLGACHGAVTDAEHGERMETEWESMTRNDFVHLLLPLSLATVREQAAAAGSAYRERQRRSARYGQLWLAPYFRLTQNTYFWHCSALLRHCLPLFYHYSFTIFTVDHSSVLAHPALLLTTALSRAPKLSGSHGGIFFL
jgi:hypothetical protein